MPVDPRDQLWNAVYETYYPSHFEEIMAEELLNRWQWVDEITKVIVALTASGSALSGWALWSQPGFRILWAILAGAGAFIAILHLSLGVPRRLNDWGEIRSVFAALRVDLQTFRYRMKIAPQFSIDEFTQEFVAYRKRYGDCIQRLKNDIVRTKRLETKVQCLLDRLVARDRASEQEEA